MTSRLPFGVDQRNLFASPAARRRTRLETQKTAPSMCRRTPAVILRTFGFIAALLTTSQAAAAPDSDDPCQKLRDAALTTIGAQQQLIDRAYPAIEELEAIESKITVVSSELSGKGKELLLLVSDVNKRAIDHLRQANSFHVFAFRSEPIILRIFREICSNTETDSVE